MKHKIPVDIALYLPSLHGGGAERVMLTLANSMAEKGYKVDLVVALAEGVFLEEVSPQIQIVDLQSKRVLFSLPKMARYLRREQPRAILSAMNHANIIAIISHILAGRNGRLIASVHGCIPLDEDRGISWKTRVVLALMRRLYPAADGIIAVSQGIASDLIQRIGVPSEKVSVIYNPIVTRDLLQKATMPIEHPWLKEGQSPVILGAGRLIQIKDFATLIRAFAEVRKKKACRLVILGEGELREKLQKLVINLNLQADVLLLGFVKNPYAWMARAKLLVLSSVSEGFGNVLVEAMASGTPVISTNCPSGPEEILEGGKWGKLVPVGDAGALSEAILAVLSGDSHKPEDLIARANVFDSPVITDQYISTLLA